VAKSEFSRRKDSLRKGSLQTGQKKCFPFQKFKELTQIVSKFTPLQEAIENIPPALPWGQVEGQPEALPEEGPRILSPSDPNALCKRLELFMTSKQAGNTGLPNEIFSIYDELLRQKILSRDAYKNSMLTLNKDVHY